MLGGTNAVQEVFPKTRQQVYTNEGDSGPLRAELPLPVLEFSSSSLLLSTTSSSLEEYQL